ncbi:hypothetical protein, partial [Escherichia coli]|uniref:hypothetical protein n=1 Tax=Escherichia coli TaxID=562 RepID=UPI003078FB66
GFADARRDLVANSGGNILDDGGSVGNTGRGVADDGRNLVSARDIDRLGLSVGSQGSEESDSGVLHDVGGVGIRLS